MSDGVSPTTFRELAGHWATGVSVVTLAGPDGKRAGMTVNSLASVSLVPPLISVCIDHGSEMHGEFGEARSFVVNVLSWEQEGVSRRFAEPHADRFAGIPYRLSSDGDPIIDGCLAHLECRVHGTIEAGDHTVVLGRVVDGAAGEGDPLLYFRGHYGTTGPS